MKKTTAPIPFAGSQLDQTRHVCAFFNNDDEEYRALLPFIRDGFRYGHKAIHVVNPDQRQDHLERLAEVGIDADAAEQRGQLELRINTDVYLPDGRFDPDRMISVFEQLASGSRLDPRHIVLTFDDGYKNNIRIIAPLLHSWNLPFTIFVSTRHISEGFGKARLQPRR